MHPARVKSRQRQEQILLSLKKLDYLTCKQIQQLHDLKGDRNARRVLQQMDTYLNSFYDGRKIYYLSKEGREKVGCQKVRSKLTTAEHYIMRNDLYIHLGKPDTWNNEIQMTSRGGTSSEITIKADSHFNKDGRHHIIEIDNQQKMNKNKIKIEKYRRLIERNSFKIAPKFIWVTTSVYRKEKLLELCEGLDVKCYLSTDFN